jgi:hypothetical protein
MESTQNSNHQQHKSDQEEVSTNQLCRDLIRASGMSTSEEKKLLPKAGRWLEQMTAGNDDPVLQAKALRKLGKQITRKAAKYDRRRESRKPADNDPGDHGDMTTDKDSLIISGAGGRGSSSPSDETLHTSQDSDKPAQRGWKHHGLGRWTRTQEDGQDEDEDANTDSSSNRPYLIIVRHPDGVEYKVEVRGNFLEENSPFFRAARSGRWNSANAPIVLEENIDFFRAYLLASTHWRTFRERISGLIASSKQHPTVGDEVPRELRREREETFEYLIGVYILADQFQDIVRANLVIDEIIRLSKETDLLPHTDAINQVYDSTLEGSPLRLLFRDLHIHEALPSVLADAARNDVHYDFLADTSIEFCNLKFNHISGTISKWFRQAVTDRPEGHYHQKPVEATLGDRGGQAVGLVPQRTMHRRLDGDV